MSVMTAPLGFEPEEPEPIEFSALVRVRCVRCEERGVAAALDQVSRALCGTCRTAEAAAATTIQRLPAVPPPPVVWEGSEKILAQNGAQRVEVLPPEHSCDPGAAVVTSLAEAARCASWEVRVVYGRGGVMGGDGKQLAVADVWSVRFRRPGWAGYAVRRGDKWDSVAVTGRTLSPFLALGVTDLREWLAEPEQPESWYAKIRKRVADQELARKVRACPGPGACHVMLVGDLFVMLTGRHDLVPDHTHRANGEIKIKKSKAEPKAGA